MLMAEILKKFERILIIGHNHTGKSKLLNDILNELNPKRQILHTDNYITTYGYVDGLYELMKVLEHKYIIEGVLGYRLLRKCAHKQITDIMPDFVLIIRSTKVIDEIDDHKHYKAHQKAYDSIYEDYLGWERGYKTKKPSVIYIWDIDLGTLL